MLGRVVYEYRVHPEERGKQLQELIESGYYLKKPELKLYSRQYLEDYVNSVKKAA